MVAGRVLGSWHALMAQGHHFSYFSVAVIILMTNGNLTKKGFILAYGCRRMQSVHSVEAWHGKNRKLADQVFIHMESRQEQQEVG